MRDHLYLYLNGEPIELAGECARWTLSDYLRIEQRLTGTKVVCAEGDCGACTVLVGRPSRESAGRLEYRSIDSCITFLHQLDGVHVVTVEGVLGPEPGDGLPLSPVQEAMVEHFGSQCGFCTPGFVMSLTELASRGELGERELRRGLTGNLCRCTGYVQILEAGRSLAASPDMARWAEAYPEAEIASDLASKAGAGARLETEQGTVFLPATVEAALDLLATRPHLRVVAGATDLGVQHNKGHWSSGDLLVLGPRLQELRTIEWEDTHLRIGACATWSEVQPAVADVFPELARILDLFGAPQIRHAGTVGGNLVNASPIADSVPFFLATDSEIELRSARGARRVPAADFHLAYKETALQPGELVAAVWVPRPSPRDLLRLVKVSRRRDLDISTFTAAARLRLQGDVIEEARVVLGGVGPTVKRLPQTEAALVSATVSEELFRRAGRLARDEIEPISDVRGSADYRRQLAENALARLGLELAAPDEAAPSTGTARTFDAGART